MWIVQMNDHGPVTNGFAEQNRDLQDEHKEIRDGVTGEGQGLSEEDESQINEDVDCVNDGRLKVVQSLARVHTQAVTQRTQQQSEGPLVHWERFLPVRSLKVLLVENDDSTRHVVTALLRNCGYEVMAVANGLQAWKLLEDLTSHFDLVLTEVVMPCLSGIGLLCKIMNHKTCKNIPVIMMSSHDSMSIVFKCLSKGAVDFLVKPIRKNELKNLWQHVWRKCHSVSCYKFNFLYEPILDQFLDSKLQSSGSGSESGIRPEKSTKSKSAEESDNNTGSNDEDDIESIGLNVRDGSDNGSGTQSSWTKRAVEVDSPKAMSPQDQLDDPPDSTCAQVIHLMPEAFSNNWVAETTKKDCEGQDDEIDNAIMGKDLKIGVPRIPNLQLDGPSKTVPTNIAGKNGEKFPETSLKRDGDQIQKGQLELNGEKPLGETRNQHADLEGAATNDTEPQIDIPNGISKASNPKEKVMSENKDMPILELSLKRLRDNGDTETGTNDRNVLRHSDLSAFSRYNSVSSAKQAPTGNLGSCSPLGISAEAAKTESRQDFQSNSNSTPPNQQSNVSSNNNDMGSTTNNASKPVVYSDKLAPKSVQSLYPSAFQPVQNGHTPLPQPMVQGKADSAIASTILANTRGMKQQVQVQHHHHHYHHHHHHVHNTSQQQQLVNHDQLSLNNVVTATPQCTSSNVLSTPIMESVGNYSLNGSASGSDHGSNGQNGSSTAINARENNMEGNNGLAAGKGGIRVGIGFGSEVGIDQSRFAHREAALNKFRQKRKERCFEKKVRYHSRKKLAEQRPRVRGQFVRQAVRENKEKDACR